MVDILERPSAEFEVAAAPAAPQRDVTLSLDADLVEWAGQNGVNISQEINDLLQFYKDRIFQKEKDADPDAWEPGQFQEPAPAP